MRRMTVLLCVVAGGSIASCQPHDGAQLQRLNEKIAALETKLSELDSPEVRMAALTERVSSLLKNLPASPTLMAMR